MSNDKDDSGQAMREAMLEACVLLEIKKDERHEPSDCKILETNRQFENVTRIPSGEALGKSIRRVLPAVEESWSEFVKNMPPGDEPAQFELHLERLDRQFLFRASRLSADRLVVCFIEVTLQKKAKDASQIHEILFENAQDIMLYIRMDGRIANANKRACEQYGYTKRELMSMRIQDLRDPSTSAEYEHQMEMADAEGIVFECVHRRRDGSTFPVEVSAKSTCTEKGCFRIHIIRDITRRKTNEAKIAWLATHDPLTGIPNRAYYIEHLEQEIRRAQRDGGIFAVMMFDLDKFKHINDHYGHEAGDVVLRHVAQTAQKALRATDQIGRFGGDEFVILQADIKSRRDAAALAERILSAVNGTIPYRDAQLHIHISIGISLFPGDAADANGLLHCADKAMYDIKNKGGGGYCFFEPCEPPCEEDRLCREPPEK